MTTPNNTDIFIYSDNPAISIAAPGTSLDILSRVKRLIPGRWFSWVAPYRDAVLGGLSDDFAWAFSLIGYARLQTRLATATGPWLDILAYDFLNRYLLRRGMDDNTFRTIIQATILQERVTRAGVQNAVTTLLDGVPPRIIEPWSTGDCGSWYGVNKKGGLFAFNRIGCWGSIQLPGQYFMQLSRQGLVLTGVPIVAGWQGYTGGWGTGGFAWNGGETSQIGVTDQQVYDIIAYTKPTGTTAWVQWKT